MTKVEMASRFQKDIPTPFVLLAKLKNVNLDKDARNNEGLTFNFSNYGTNSRITQVIQFVVSITSS